MNLIFSKYSVFFYSFRFFLLFRSQGRPMIQLLLHLLGFCWQKAVTLLPEVKISR